MRIPDADYAFSRSTILNRRRPGFSLPIHGKEHLLRGGEAGRRGRGGEGPVEGGPLVLHIPPLGLGAGEYHRRPAKAHGDLKPVVVVKLDKKTGKEVVSREV